MCTTRGLRGRAPRARDRSATRRSCRRRRAADNGPERRQGGGPTVRETLSAVVHPRAAKVHAIAKHRDALGQEQNALPFSLGQAAIGPDDPMPGDVGAGRRQDLPDHPGRVRIDVAVRSHEPWGNLAYPAQDAIGPGLCRLRCWRRAPAIQYLVTTAISERTHEPRRPSLGFPGDLRGPHRGREVRTWDLTVDQTVPHEEPAVIR